MRWEAKPAEPRVVMSSVPWNLAVWLVRWGSEGEGRGVRWDYYGCVSCGVGGE